MGDGGRLIADAPGGRLVLLTDDLEPTAVWPQAGTHSVSVGRGLRGWQVLVSRGYQDKDLLHIERQSLLVRAWARYAVLIQVVVAAVLLWLFWQLVAMIRRWRQAALGMPTLDRVNAMVLLLDRKGRVVFANKHPLTQRLVNRPHGRRLHYRDSGLATQLEIVTLLDKAFSEPMGVTQHYIELDSEKVPVRLELVVYPYVDHNNAYRGKIVVAEDLAGRQAWQWKVVLGDAAQKWVHRLKHHLGTARMIIGNIGDDGVISERLRTSPELKEQWEAVDLQIVRGSEVAGRILKYLRNTHPQLAPCDINNLVRMVATSKAAEWSDRIDLNFELTDQSTVIQADSEQMQEVFDNLLSNAAQAIRNHGGIVARTQIDDDTRGETDRRWLKITVEDTGAGIESDDLPKIFEPGFSKSENGTGIGLALVKEIVDNHGGEIDVSSEPGKGTRFVIRLPA
jgi:signal transduction histidine kinase